MDEISSIAYNVEDDPCFFLEPVGDAKYSGYEMSNTLSKYLIGNGFIEYLAYYRISEPDKIYTSHGELSFIDFGTSYLGLDKDTANGIINGILSTNIVAIKNFTFGEDGDSFFSYLCPLLQFSKNPQAYVFMLIPVSEVKPLLES